MLTRESMMDHSTAPNFNLIKLQFLPEFIQGVFDDTVDIDQTETLEHLRKELELFETCVENYFSDEAGENLLNLENLRNELLEIILDRLDDHLNIHVHDWYHDLDQLRITEKEAMRRQPEFGAAIRLLGENREGNPDFHTALKRDGHVWDESHYRTLLNRFESKEFKPEEEYLGIAERVVELLAVDHRQQKLVDDLNKSEDLKELRSVRYRIYRDVTLLNCEIYIDTQRVKTKNNVRAIELIIDDLNADIEERQMLTFSLNDLPYDQFFTYLEGINDESVDAQFHELLTGEILPAVKGLRDAVAPFMRSREWKEIEESEAILFRAVERFMMELPGNTLCPGAADYKALWEKFESSPRFRTASELLEELEEAGVVIDRSFSRGDVPQASDIPRMIEFLTQPPQREKLEMLRLWPLFLEICESDARSRELIIPAMKKYKTVELDELRDRRWTLSGLLELIQLPEE